MSKNNAATYQDLKLYEFLKNKIEDTLATIGREVYRIEHGREITAPIRTTYGKRNIYLESWELLESNDVKVKWGWYLHGDTEYEELTFPSSYLDDPDWKDKHRQVVEARRKAEYQKRVQEQAKTTAQDTAKRRVLYEELKREFGEED